MMSFSLHGLRSIAETQKAYANKDTSVKAVVEQYLKAIDELDPELNAITFVNKEALRDAEQLDVSFPA